jgi:hypothetical protein
MTKFHQVLSSSNEDLGFATMKDSKKFLSVFGGHLAPRKIPSKEEEGYYSYSLMGGILRL